VVLHQFPNWASSIIDLQLMSIQLFIILMLWFLLEIHAPWLMSIVLFGYTLSSKATFRSYLLLGIFISMFYTLDTCSKILYFTFVSMIPTYVIFTYWIVLGKLIVPMENNYGSVAKMISSSSFVMPLCRFWHFWWNYLDAKSTMFQFTVTHWYPLWCNMWMWIPL
jgi:hypothetical protein